MKTGVKLFISSGSFGTAIAVAYWFSAHEWTGTLLLGIMACGLSFAAAYIVVAEREARLAGDRPDASSSEEAGVQLGAFITSSFGPILAAGGACLTLVGLVLSSGVAFFGFALLIVALTRLVLES